MIKKQLKIDKTFNKIHKSDLKSVRHLYFLL